ncbi:hypothetical protein EVAR_14764_1 [Eumeta japonica]|uniref:Pro-neuropeptide Y n=1 Tax=Eumeta variegata TaxID=151549 RepID=A0A4C1TWE1_EUMVA|nr:hypothetical protein EVAR_14764_1 [Eumeta japonica]
MRLSYAILLLGALVLHASLTRGQGAAQYPRPRRPERFDTAEQISNYLKELQEYYSVHGRGSIIKIQVFQIVNSKNEMIWVTRIIRHSRGCYDVCYDIAILRLGLRLLGRLLRTYRLR